MDDLSFVKSASSWDSGGGVLIDVIELKDGRVLGVTDEVVILYNDLEDLMSGGGNPERPCITL